MSAHDSKLMSIIKCECPRCHEGKLFTHGLTYNIKKMTEMPEQCPVCGLHFTPEPGYYYGAMYVSYGFAVAEFVAVITLAYLLFGDLSTAAMAGIIAGVFLVLAPINFRLGRSGWISIFYKFDPSYTKKGKTQHS